jgi:rSAM/selenodomain-associated transferase 2
MQVSIVIPILNGAENLVSCFEPLRGTTVREVILVDGGSTDDSVEVARSLGAVVLCTPAGRGLQMQAGAVAAESDWLLFLHADTVLASNWPAAVYGLNPCKAGYFRLCFDSRRRVARWLEYMVAARCHWLGLPYGDQGLLIHRDLLTEIGGMPELPLMEDIAIVRRLGRKRLQCLDAVALTSAARYEQDGFFCRPLKNLFCLALYLAGISPRHIQKLYG